jgi:hypothetical protein
MTASTTVSGSSSGISTVEGPTVDGSANSLIFWGSLLPVGLGTGCEGASGVMTSASALGASVPADGTAAAVSLSVWLVGRWAHPSKRTRKKQTMYLLKLKDNGQSFFFAIIVNG